MSALTELEVEALQEALEDEYLAWATYDQVIADFGKERPFNNIRDAEARHIEALLTLFARYGLPAPENPWPGKVQRHNSLQDACQAGIASEIANGEMYERLLRVTERPDILAVLRNLQEASQQRHLPAFKRCAQRLADGAYAGGGRGRGRGPRGKRAS